MATFDDVIGSKMCIAPDRLNAQYGWNKALEQVEKHCQEKLKAAEAEVEKGGHYTLLQCQIDTLNEIIEKIWEFQ